MHGPPWVANLYQMTMTTVSAILSTTLLELNPIFWRLVSQDVLVDWDEQR